jgi:hypothetical protein
MGVFKNPGNSYRQIGWRWLMVLVVLLPALAAANLVSLRLHGGDYPVTIDDGFDKLLLSRVHSVEEDGQGRRYRWTKGDGTITLHSFATVRRAVLLLGTGGLPDTFPTPRMVETIVDDAPLITLAVRHTPRTYALLLPPTALQDGDLRVSLRSDTSKVDPDPRPLGIRIDSLGLRWFAGEWAFLPWGVLLVQTLLVATLLALVWQLGFPRWSIAALAVALVIGLGWMTGHYLLVAAAWLVRLLVAGGATLALFLGSSPLLERAGFGRAYEPALRWLWLIVLFSIGLRMVGSLFPPFDSHDWYIHRARIIKFISGTMLVYDHPAEFSRKLTIVPSAPYILFHPFTLLTRNLVVAMQGVYTFFDGVTTLLVGLLVRRIGGSARAAWGAALLVALFPLTFTAVWWGFGPQVIGQTLVVLLALLLTRRAPPTRTFWMLAGLVLTLLLLTHIGAGILGGFMLAGYTLLLLLVRRRQTPSWKGWGVLMIACGILVILLLYIDVIALQMRGLAGNDRLGWDEGDLFRVIWTLHSLYISFDPLVMHLTIPTETLSSPVAIGATLALVGVGLVLPLVSMVFLVVVVKGVHRLLVGAWLGSALLFFVIDMVFGLQVRYAYFAVPMVVAGLALLLDHLIARHRAGWLIAGALIGLVGLAGWHLWFESFILWIKPSLRGLTH